MTRPAHNTCAVKDAANGTLSAQYEYGPFVEVIRMTGAMARFNPIRWSTKYQDDEIDLVYCGYPETRFGRRGNRIFTVWRGNNPISLDNRYCRAGLDPDDL